MCVRIVSILFLLLQAACIPAFSEELPGLFLQVVAQHEGTVLLEYQVNRGDHFHIDYTHSSDHTPVHDVFRIEERGIVLIEESFDWYGSGLEFRSNEGAKISLAGKKTRVFLNRECPRFLLRVGRVAGHVITYKDNRVSLLSIAEGGDSVWIRLVQGGGKE